MVLVGGLKLAPRPGIFAIMNFHKMDVLLFGWKLTGVAFTISPSVAVALSYHTRDGLALAT